MARSSIVLCLFLIGCVWLFQCLFHHFMYLNFKVFSVVDNIKYLKLNENVVYMHGKFG